MDRIHFIEFHEQAWVPSMIRDYVTDALQFGFNLFELYGRTVALVERALDATGSRSIVDLCSGGGGPWIELSRGLEARRTKAGKTAVTITLTDKFPNLGAFERLKTVSKGRLSFYPGPVEATNLPEELTRTQASLRTSFTSFHHFRPKQARAILQNAVDSGDAIGVFEATRRAPMTILAGIGFVLVLFLATPWMRPFRWSRLLFTYLLPIVPFFLWFDGIVSNLRSYGPGELRELTGQLGANGKKYHWETGELATRFTPITYLIGWPVSGDPGISDFSALLRA
jgi:hypothetical protein